MSGKACVLRITNYDKQKRKNMKLIGTYTPEMVGSGQYGVCVKCGLPPTKDGHDGCIGELKDRNIMNACCGHGNDNQAYVQLWSNPDNAIRGDKAIILINHIKKRVK